MFYTPFLFVHMGGGDGYDVVAIKKWRASHMQHSPHNKNPLILFFTSICFYLERAVI